MTIITVILGVLCLIVFGVCLVLVGSSTSSVVNDFHHLDQSPCGDITITDKFTSVNGGALSVNTNYYVSTDRNTFEMLITTNASEIHRFNQIQVGQTLPLKTYGGYAEFCDSSKLLKGFD